MILFSIGFPETERLEVHAPDGCRLPTLHDWLSVTVKVRAGGFSGEVDISIVPAEALAFKTALEPVYRDLRGHAEFVTMERQLYVKVEVDKFGHITASGFLNGDFDSKNQLRFTLCFDQTLLWHTIAEIDEFLFAAKE